MEFKYRIYKEVYNDMLSGKKNIEFRLLNDKSESIKVGDTIKFIIIDDENKYLVTKVIDKFIYDDLDSLCDSDEYLNNNLDCSKEEFVSLFNKIFGEENVRNSKIVGFKIEINVSVDYELGEIYESSIKNK